MTALPPAAQRAQARLRDRAEMHLRLAAMDDLRRAHPDVTSKPRRPSGVARKFDAVWPPPWIITTG